jgi:ribonuclease P protein component
MGERFGSEARLHNHREFTAVQSGGRRVAGRFCILVGKPNARAHDRLGIIASRRVGSAIERNRAKRRLREVFRRRLAGAPTGDGLDVVAIAKTEITRAPFADVQQDFVAAWSKLRGAR